LIYVKIVIKQKTVPPHTKTHVISVFQEPGSIPVQAKSTSQKHTNRVGVKPEADLKLCNDISIRDLFMNTWKKDLHLKPKIKVLAICMVQNEVLKGAFELYQSKLLKDGTEVNEKLLWHGTGTECNLYSAQYKFCISKNCGTCNISQNNFYVTRAQSNISWGRFGNGIYFSPCSSKSHDYNAHSEKNGVRNLLLCRVTLGKTFVSQYNMDYLQGPPQGHHSVTGEPGEDPNNRHLNYPEVVIWEERSILPVYVVFYSIAQ